MDDFELLRRYVRSSDEQAFAELVRRHVGLVYSAAMRRVRGDVQVAEDISQRVFITLARKAPSLLSRSVLAGWLYVTAQTTAAEFVRTSERRRRREESFQLMNDTAPDSEPVLDWDRLGPAMDEAISSLRKSDQEVIVLRFFEGMPYTQIGAALSVSENTARMRVERALERLRAPLARKGITSTATALTLLLSNQVTAAIPSGLVASLTGTALANAASGMTAAGGAAVALEFMSTSKIITVGASAVACLAIGSTVYFAHENAALRERLLLRERPTFTSNPESRRPPPSLASNAAVLQDLIEENRRLRTASQEISDPGALRVADLKFAFDQLPDQRIPEMALATDADWRAASEGDLETPEDYRRAMAQLRTKATARFVALVHPVLRAYLAANGDQFPTDVFQLQAYFNEGDDVAPLKGYHIVPASEVRNVGMGGDWIITQVALIDSDYDSRFVVGKNGLGSTSRKGASR